MKYLAMLLGVTLSFVLQSGCKSASPAPSVQVVGSSAARDRLVGKWQGEYHSAATGRRGTIVFEFGRGDVAHGDVLMMPEGASEPVQPTQPEPATETLRRLQVLRIRLVEVSEGALTGVLDPYTDPNCQCEVRTSFNGTIRGNLIAGTFTTKSTAGMTPDVTGQWSVTRR